MSNTEFWGLVQVPSSSALTLRRDVLHEIRQIATRRRAQGRIRKLAKTDKGTFDAQLATHIRKHVEGLLQMALHMSNSRAACSWSPQPEGLTLSLALHCQGFA